MNIEMLEVSDVLMVIKAAEENSRGCLKSADPFVQRILKLDQLYTLIAGNQQKTQTVIGAMFLQRSHSAWIAATRLATAGQFPEAYMVLRGSLENGLYGFHLWKNPEEFELWHQRDRSPEDKSAFRGKFTYARTLSTLRLSDPDLGRFASELYEIAIDRGAHPNPHGHISGIERRPEQGPDAMQTIYLSANADAKSACLKSVALVAVCILRVFGKVFPERYDLLGIAAELPTLESGL